MKTRNQILTARSVLLALTSAFSLQPSALVLAAPLGTTFTYQGRLQDDAQAAVGLYDLRFTLHDALSGGSAIGNSLTKPATGVTNGLFTVSLDFGATVFDGNARWLAIEVRTNGAGSFALLSPRQPLSPAPNAIYATKAGAAASATTAMTANTANAVAAGSVGTAELTPAVLSNTFWRLGGNTATSPSTQYLGTTDNQPLEFKANGQRALRLEPGTGGLPNIIGGAAVNTVDPGVFGAVIGGGGAPAWPHRVAANYATIAGGIGHEINSGANQAAIGGGAFNVIESSAAGTVIGGGHGNRIQSSAVYSAIGGGLNNTNGLNAIGATIPGGRDNYAGGLASFAAGRRAKALTSGAFVWADYTDADFASTGQNQFLIRAGGGVGIGTNNPQAALHVAGTVMASNFVGSGIGLTTLSGAALADSSITAAKFAPGAVNHLDAPDGSPLNAVQVSTNGLVGIGTSSPQAGLDLQASGSHLTLSVLSQVPDGTWGFTNLLSAGSVAASGNLVAVGAYLGGVTLADVSNPEYPQVVWQARDETGGFTNLQQVGHVCLASNLLAITAGSDHAVTLVSVTNPASPVKLAELIGGRGSLTNCSGPESVAIAGNLMAVVGSGDHSVALVSLANPANPIQMSVIKHGAGAFTNLFLPVSAALSGNLLAVAAQGSHAVTLVSVANPASPVKLAEIRHGTGSYTNLDDPTCVALSGNLMAIMSIWSDVTLVDVSNPSLPVWLANLPAPHLGYGGISRAPTALAFSGNRLAVAAYNDNQVRLYDIADPVHPQLLSTAKAYVGGADYLHGPQGLAFAGTNLVVAASWSSAATVLGFSPAPFGLFSQGWVGIGIRLPAAPLHVVGNVVVEDAQLFNVNTRRVAMGDRTTATDHGAVALGVATRASSFAAAALGNNTTASGGASTALGNYTTASGGAATAMGWSTSATNSSATSMGSNTLAGGAASLAAGTRAKAIHNGTFVWADHTAADFTSTASNQFLIRASGGVGIGTNNPQAALHVAGTVLATQFAGDGSNLTNLNAWHLGGNAGTTPGQSFLGTTDNQPLEFKVFGERALRLEPNGSDSPNVIGGFKGNVVSVGIYGATIGGGGGGPFFFAQPNRVEGNYATVVGGRGNTASGEYSTAMGYSSTASGDYSTSMGDRTSANGYNSTAMGNLTTASGWYSTAMGSLSDASGNSSMAAGTRAKALHPGTFVWADSQNVDFSSTANNQFLIRAAGGVVVQADDTDVDSEANQLLIRGHTSNAKQLEIGYKTSGNYGTIQAIEQSVAFRPLILQPAGGRVGIGKTDPASALEVNGTVTATAFNPSSDRNLKEKIAPVNPVEVLDKVAALPISRWNFKGDAATPHVGPMAQDFHAAFGVGTDDKHIATVDADGVALAAIQGLNQKLDETRAELKRRDVENAALIARLEKLERLMNHQNEALR